MYLSKNLIYNYEPPHEENSWPSDFNEVTGPKIFDILIM